MADSIESFVNKLQNEGVEAGRKEAETIRADAQKEADRIVKEAEEKAEKIRQDAERDAEDTRQRGRTDLELAARDTVLRLRETLNRALRTVLVRGTEESLRDTDFLKGLIHDVVMQYAQADQEGKTSVEVRVSDEAIDDLTEWCRQQLAPEAQDAGAAVDIKGTLAEAGFEYQVQDANVEVTQTSVVETLQDLVSPRLRDMLAKATEEKDGDQDASADSGDSGDGNE
jgi:vacuolar-type H+-ATPase subunit E/Vma4